MNPSILTAWLWCQLSISKLYIDMLTQTDEIIIAHNKGDGWTQERLNKMLVTIAEKANTIASQLTRAEFAPTAITEHCIFYMMNWGIKFEPVIIAAITKIEL